MSKITRTERKAEQIRYMKKLIRLYERKGLEFARDQDARAAIRMFNAERLAADELKHLLAAEGAHR
jgi:hypothetical protein